MNEEYIGPRINVSTGDLQRDKKYKSYLDNVADILSNAVDWKSFEYNYENRLLGRLFERQNGIQGKGK